jgi:hypothetical protein
LLSNEVSKNSESKFLVNFQNTKTEKVEPKSEKTYTGHFLRKHQLMHNDLFSRRNSHSVVLNTQLPTSAESIPDAVGQPAPEAPPVNEYISAVEQQFKNIDKLFGKTGESRPIVSQFPKNSKNPTGFLYQNLMPLHVYELKPDIDSRLINKIVQVGLF